VLPPHIVHGSQVLMVLDALKMAQKAAAAQLPAEQNRAVPGARNGKLSVPMASSAVANGSG